MVELYPHQRTAVDKMGNGKVLVGGVGTGKTITSLFYFYERVMGGTVGDFNVPTPMDIYVFTTARKRDDFDWQETAIKLGISTKRELSGVKGVQLVVDSYNNIQKYVDIKDAFIILDEQRMVGTGAWTKTFLKMAKHNKWIMLSATPGDTWEDYAALFIANGFYKNITEYKRRHMVYSYYGKFPKLERYVETGRLLRLKASILVEMPYERHTTRHIHDVLCDYDKPLFERVVKDRWHVYEERPLKDVSELFSVMRKVVNSDRARLKAVRELMEKHPRLIVFYNFDYELEQLRSLATESLLTDSLSPSTVSTESRTLSGVSRGTPSKSQPTLSTTTTDSSWDTDTTQSSRTRTMTSDSRQSSSSDRLSRKHESLSTSISGSGTSESTRTSTAAQTDPWSGTIWAKDWEPREGQDDPRKSVDNQIVHSKFESWARREDRKPPRRVAKSWQPNSTTSSENSETSKSSSRSSFSNSSLLMPDTGQTLSVSNYQASSQQSSKASSNISGETSTLRKASSTTTADTQPEPSPKSTSPIVVAEWNGHKHEPTPTGERWVYLVQYLAGAEAWNCVTTDAMVFYSQTYSYKNFQQAQGRIDRLNTPYKDLHYYVLKSKAAIDLMISKSLREKKNFNEADYFGSL